MISSNHGAIIFFSYFELVVDLLAHIAPTPNGTVTVVHINYDIQDDRVTRQSSHVNVTQVAQRNSSKLPLFTFRIIWNNWFCRFPSIAGHVEYGPLNAAHVECGPLCLHVCQFG